MSEREETLRQRVVELESILKQLTPKPHWSEATRSLVMRLRGIYAIGPNADQMGPNDQPEFGWRQYPDRPAIQFEAAQRIADLEEENADLRRQIEGLTEWDLDVNGR